MFGIKVIFSILLNLAIYGILLFLPAGTWHWWRAWVFLAVIAVATAATLLLVFSKNQALLAERLKSPIQKGQPFTDKVLVVCLLATVFGQVAFVPFDVFRYHLLPRPGILVSSLGMVMTIAGWWIISLVFQANAFAAPVVRHQVERSHRVVDTGVYAVVRHPMYAGAILFMAGYCLWLESYAAALLSFLIAAILMLRILAEEKFLARELPGYAEYRKRVRWRLAPWIW